MTPNEWHRPQAAWAAQARCSECGASKAGLHEPGCQVAMSENRAMQNAGPEALSRMNAGALNAVDPHWVGYAHETLERGRARRRQKDIWYWIDRLLGLRA